MAKRGKRSAAKRVTPKAWLVAGPELPVGGAEQGTMQPANYQKHAQHQHVAMFEWVYLLNGKEPPHHWAEFRRRYVDVPDSTAPMFDELPETYKALKAGMDSKQLLFVDGPIGWYGLRRIEPSELLRWVEAYRRLGIAPDLRAAIQRAIVPSASATHRNVLTDVIEIAKHQATRQTSSAIWAAFVRLAESANPPAPLLEFIDGEGVKYRDDATIKIFTRKNLGDRLRRERAKAR